MPSRHTFGENLFPYSPWATNMYSIFVYSVLSRGAQTSGIPAPPWRKSCLGPHIKYISTRNHTKNLTMF